MSRSPSIQRRLVLILTTTVTALFALVAILIHILVEQASLAELDRGLVATVEEFVAETQIDAEGLDPDFHQSAQSEFSQGATTAFYELRDSSGEIVARSASLSGLAELPVLRREPGTGEITTIDLADVGKARGITAVFLPEIDLDDDEEIPPGVDLESQRTLLTLTVAKSTAPVASQLAILERALLVAGLLLALGSWLAVAIVAGWLNRPIVRLANVARQIDVNALDQRLPHERTPRELEPVVRQFNLVLDRLSESLGRERRFSAGLAHELRTPAAEIRALAEVALTESEDPALQEDPREVLAAVRTQAEHMTGLIETISSLHGAGSGKESNSSEPLELAAIVTETAERFRTRAAERNQTLLLQTGDDSVRALGDSTLTTAIVQNLIQNAVEHAPMELKYRCKPSANKKLRWFGCPTPLRG